MDSEDEMLEGMIPQIAENFNNWLKLMPNDWMRQDILRRLNYCRVCGAELNKGICWCCYED